MLWNAIHLCTKCSLCLWNKVRVNKIDNPIILYAIPLILVSYERELHEQQSFLYEEKRVLEKVPVKGRILLCSNVWIYAWAGNSVTSGTSCWKKSVMKGFTSGILFFFSVPCAGLFSVKNRKKFLAINNFFVNETKSGHPNKHLFSLTFRELNG